MFIDDHIVWRIYKNLESRPDSRLVAIDRKPVISIWMRQEQNQFESGSTMNLVDPSITSHLTEIIRMQMHRTDDVAGIFTAFGLAS